MQWVDGTGGVMSLSLVVRGQMVWYARRTGPMEWSLAISPANGVTGIDLGQWGYELDNIMDMVLR